MCSQQGLRLDQKKPSWWFQNDLCWGPLRTVAGSGGEEQDDPGSSCQSGRVWDMGDGTLAGKKASFVQVVAGKLGVCPDYRFEASVLRDWMSRALRTSGHFSNLA